MRKVLSTTGSLVIALFLIGSRLLQTHPHLCTQAHLSKSASMIRYASVMGEVIDVIAGTLDFQFLHEYSYIDESGQVSLQRIYYIIFVFPFGRRVMEETSGQGTHLSFEVPLQWGVIKGRSPGNPQFVAKLFYGFASPLRSSTITNSWLRSQIVL